MTKTDDFLFKMVLIFLGGWFFSTIVVDFFAVPNVFRTVTNLYEAGRVGIKIFARFNILELIFAVFICSCFWKIPLGKNKVGRWSARVLSLALVLLVLFYLFHLNPNIVKYSDQIHEIGAGNIGYEIAQKEHSFYHHLYVKLDGFKLLSLLVLQVLGLTAYSTTNQGELR